MRRGLVAALAVVTVAGCGGSSTERLSVQSSGGAAGSTAPAPAPSLHVLTLPPPSPAVVTASAGGIGTASGVPVTVGPATTSSSPRPTRTVSSGQTVTTADSGETVRMAVGATLTVDLDSSFHQPTSSEESVLMRLAASGGYPTGSHARATFRARARGRADLTSYDDYACLHATPRCMVAQREWIVHVLVA